jgi:thiamine biosynthesis lipoprotein
MKNNSILLLLVFTGIFAFSQSVFKQDLTLMGCKFDITVIAKSQEQADEYINVAIEEMQRIENLISSWKRTSQTTAINKNAGIQAVVVDDELFQLIKRSMALSTITDGAFDISYAAIDHVWKFNGQEISMPDETVLAASVKAIGYQKIVLNEKDKSVFLTKKGMKIGFGAIGKGYAADRARAILQQKGVVGGIINASGDMNSWGEQPNGKPWKVAIVNPMDVSKNYGLFELINGAVVTSGNYEKFVIIDGERYAHIIDPRTGMPSKGILSVTVFAPKAEMADALATAVFVMGADVGIALINQLPNTEAVIVKNDGSLSTSTNINILTK